MWAVDVVDTTADIRVRTTGRPVTYAAIPVPVPEDVHATSVVHDGVDETGSTVPCSVTLATGVSAVDVAASVACTDQFWYGMTSAAVAFVDDDPENVVEIRVGPPCTFHTGRGIRRRP